jgi:DNA topoisomerase-1
MVYRQIDPKTGEAEGYAPTQSFIEAKFVKPKQGQTHTVGGVYIDPSWTRVLVASNPEARRQVIGVDKTGRLQGKYLASHSADSTANKFDRIKSFTKMLPKIKSQVLRDLGQIEEAQLCYLMLKTGMRVGREPGVEQEKRSFAASTLRNEHVHIEGDVVTMDFIGKAGVKHHLAVKDRTLARMMSIKKDQTQQGQRLFTKNHDNIRDYLRGISGQDFSSKDFRTYVGTSLAIKLMGESAVPTKKREFTAFRNKIVGTVSNQLGNTPTIAFKYYIDPHVWEPWVASLAEQGVTFKARKKADETELEHGGAGYV